jgi:hypothetical protein
VLHSTSIEYRRGGGRDAIHRDKDRSRVCGKADATMVVRIARDGDT